MTTKTSKSGGRGQPSGLTSGGKKSKGGKKGRRPVPPVKVGRDRNWGPIAMFVAVGLIAAGIIGFAWWSNVDRGVRGEGTPWEERAAEIEGIVNHRESNPDMLTSGHEYGELAYEVLPPVGGNHNFTWQNCQGDVYAEPLHEEHAVHSLEHGAVWVTYRPDLPADQVESLTDRVEGNDMLFLSPFPDLDAPISLQAWGYQLKVNDAGDDRIDDFIRVLRRNATMEPGAVCSGGFSTTASTPSLNAGG